MGQINEATIRMFKTRLARGEHINSTHSEEEQLVNVWEKLQSASISEPVNQQLLTLLKLNHALAYDLATAELRDATVAAIAAAEAAQLEGV